MQDSASAQKLAQSTTLVVKEKQINQSLSYMRLLIINVSARRERVMLQHEDKLMSGDWSEYDALLNHNF